MKKYALYILLGILAGCSRSTLSHRKTNETILSDSVSVAGNMRNEQDKQQGNSSEQHTRTSEEDRIVIKFDTEKPATKETGLPPVKEISFTGTTTNQESKLNNTISTEKNIKSVSSDSTAVSHKAEIKENIKTEKVVKTTGLWKALFYICLIVFSYYLFDAIRPKIKRLWEKIRKL